MKKKSNKPSETANRPRVVKDPAEKYYDKARRDREEYDKAVKAASPWAEFLGERNFEALGAAGNPRSKQAFDPRSFRNR